MQCRPILHVSGNFRGTIVEQGAVKSVGPHNTCTQSTQDGFVTIPAPMLNYCDIYIGNFDFEGYEGISCESEHNGCDGM